MQQALRTQEAPPGASLGLQVGFAAQSKGGKQSLSTAFQVTFGSEEQLDSLLNPSSKLQQTP